MPKVICISFKIKICFYKFFPVGVGIDDMIIIMTYLSHQKENLPIEIRIGNALRDSGQAITITTATDVFSFLVGSYGVSVVT